MLQCEHKIHFEIHPLSIIPDHLQDAVAFKNQNIFKQLGRARGESDVTLQHFGLWVSIPTTAAYPLTVLEVPCHVFVFILYDICGG